MRVGARIRRARRRGRLRPTRGGGGVRRRHRVPRALRRAAAPHRGAGVRRRARRTSSTCSSASARSSAATRRSSKRRPLPPSTTRCGRAIARRRGGRGARRSGYVNAGTVEFVLDADGPFCLPRGEHAPAGGAPGHRAGHRPRPRRAAACASRRASRCPPKCSARRCTVTRSRPGSTPRTSPRAILPTSGPLDRFAIPRGRRRPGRRRVRRRLGRLHVLRRDARQGGGVGAHTRRSRRAACPQRCAARKLHGADHQPRPPRAGAATIPSSSPGATDTGFLERHDAISMATASPGGDAVRLHAVAAVLAAQAVARDRSPLPAGIPAGWRNVGPVAQAVRARR